MKLRNAAAGLANDPLFADLQPPHLRRADAQLADAVTSLEGTDSSAAVAAEEKALGMLREELDSPGRTGRTDRADDRRRPNFSAEPAIKPRTAARPKASRRTPPGWETSASPCEKT